MTVTIYIATGNAGKLRDFTAAKPAHIALAPLPGLDGVPAPEEDQPSFEGNARLKAIYYSRFALGQIVLADDSGLEVQALRGQPGVRSARYAEDAGLASAEPADVDQRNNLYLLQQFRKNNQRESSLPRTDPRTPGLTPTHARRARYRCILAAARDGIVLATAEGTVEGEILLAPRGSGGFGYDPLFYLPALGKTMAELDSATRLELSHRGRTLRALLPRLAQYLP
jgi:XTP/dITP diphosphohydrolase